MQEIKYTTRFKHDYRREKSGRHSKQLDVLLIGVVNLLAADRPLPGRNFDHPLSGESSDHRDCHIEPDLILIYRKPDDDSPRIRTPWLTLQAWAVKTAGQNSPFCVTSRAVGLGPAGTIDAHFKRLATSASGCFDNAAAFSFSLLRGSA